MGTFLYPVEIGDFEGKRFVPIEALVDPGATYTSVPRELLEQLGIEPREQRDFILANGQRSSYGVAWIRMRLDGREEPTIVIFGDAGSRALLGAFALEGFGLAVDPIGKKLTPVDGYLVGIQEALLCTSRHRLSLKACARKQVGVDHRRDFPVKSY